MKRVIGILFVVMLCIILGASLEWTREAGISLIG